jgi:hypothetical protein
MNDTAFQDSQGRTWLVESPIDWPTVHRVKSLASIDLHSVKRGVPPLPATDPPRTRLALYAVVKVHADHANITREDFCASITDPAIEASAIAAVMEALADATPPELRDQLAGRSPFRGSK